VLALEDLGEGGLEALGAFLALGVAFAEEFGEFLGEADAELVEVNDRFEEALGGVVGVGGGGLPEQHRVDELMEDDAEVVGGEGGREGGLARLAVFSAEALDEGLELLGWIAGGQLG